MGQDFVGGTGSIMIPFYMKGPKITPSDDETEVRQLREQMQKHVAPE